MILERRNSFWWALLGAIIVTGIVSRVGQTGFRIVDKYLGDALYAAMVYVLFRLTNRITRVALWTSVAMIAIELFQLTGIAAEMFRSGNTAVRIGARLLGTDFGVADLVAYAAGIACMVIVRSQVDSAAVRRS